MKGPVAFRHPIGKECAALQPINSRHIDGRTGNRPYIVYSAPNYGAEGHLDPMSTANVRICGAYGERNVS